MNLLKRPADFAGAEIGSARPLAGAVRAGYGCAGDDLHDNAARLGAAFGLHGYIASSF
jgi:hypothetical protein